MFLQTISIQVRRFSHYEALRQVLTHFHRPKDVGRSKAVVAAEFVMARVPGVSVSSYVLASIHLGIERLNRF